MWGEMENSRILKYAKKRAKHIKLSTGQENLFSRLFELGKLVDLAFGRIGI